MGARITIPRPCGRKRNNYPVPSWPQKWKNGKSGYWNTFFFWLRPHCSEPHCQEEYPKKCTEVDFGGPCVCENVSILSPKRQVIAYFRTLRMKKSFFRTLKEFLHVNQDPVLRISKQDFLGDQLNPLKVFRIYSLFLVCCGFLM